MEKFNHQYFEIRLLSDAALSPDESQELQRHLQGCEACSRLAAAWSQVRAELHAAPLLAPAPGFAQRWKERHALARQRQHRRQVLFTLMFSVGGAALLFLILGLLSLPLLISPRPVLLLLVYQLTAFFSAASDAAGVTRTLVQALGNLVPPTLWVGMGVAAAGLLVIWLAAVLRLVKIGRVPVWDNQRS
jgi:anti-sigma factor RsiW